LRADEEKRFSGALTKFLEKECIIRNDVSIADEQLFHRFATFWSQAPEHFDHPALLGQFRVALTQRGFLQRLGRQASPLARPHSSKAGTKENYEERKAALTCLRLKSRFV
jgi:hypothetical protein